MSGGERSKRRSKPGHPCWEEAGGEFYQESYPADVDMEALQRDPAHIATMLPSKQVSRSAPTQSRGSVRRRSSVHTRRLSTARRGSTTNEVHLSSLPDLTDESIPNEEKTSEEILRIKAMPVCMSRKRDMKDKLQNAPKLRLQGWEAWKWQRRKNLQHLHSRVYEFVRELEVWQQSLKRIEGSHGTGVVSLFLFIKWLLRLNLFLCLLLLPTLMLPSVLSKPTVSLTCTNDTVTPTSVGCCSANYSEQVTGNDSKDPLALLQDMLQGTGWLEQTILFQGFYPSVSVWIDTWQYNLPLAYIIVFMAFFLFSLVAMVRSTAKGFRESMLEREGHFYHYCNLLFGGWDFCIDNPKAAISKHKALLQEVRATIAAERFQDEKHSRSKLQKVRLFLVRCLVNLIVLAVLAGAGAAMYYATRFSIIRLNEDAALINNDENTKESFWILFLEFLPSLTLTLLNLIVPLLFQVLVCLEHYSPPFQVKITLIRTIFLRLANLGFLVGSLYSKVECPISVNECSCQLVCWETYVGQQLYKLALLDFFILAFLTFFVDFPRMLVAKCSHSRWSKIVGDQEFDLAKHALDIVYGQTLCWMGSFYAPLLPVVASVKCFLLFYIKKFACLVNCRPSSTVYRASRSSSMFMLVLLISFVVALLPVAFSVAHITPSRSCGPFRGLHSSWEEVVVTLSSWPHWITSAMFFLGTAGFAVPVLLVLILSLYYFYAVAAANKHMVSVLKSQLVLEGHDKQFLLHRLNFIIRKHQELMHHGTGDYGTGATSTYDS